MPISQFSSGVWIRRWEWYVFGGTTAAVTIASLWLWYALQRYGFAARDDVFVKLMHVPAIAILVGVFLPLCVQPANLMNLSMSVVISVPHMGDMGESHMSAALVVGYSLLSVLLIAPILAVRIWWRVRRDAAEHVKRRTGLS